MSCVARYASRPLRNELACAMKGGNICCQQLIDDLLAFIGC